MTLYPVPKPKRTPKRMARKTRSVRSATSGGHLFPKLVSRSRRTFIRRQRCIATGRHTGEWVYAEDWMPPTLKALCPYKARIVAAHVKPGRGAAGPDEGNMVPLEWLVHDWCGQVGWGVLRKRLGLMPISEVAAFYEARYQRETGAP